MEAAKAKMHHCIKDIRDTYYIGLRLVCGMHASGSNYGSRATSVRNANVLAMIIVPDHISWPFIKL